MVGEPRNVLITLTLFALILVGGSFIGQANAFDFQPREADCEEGLDNTYVEQIISDADCSPDNQGDLIGHVENKDMPQFSIGEQTLDYDESTRIQVEIWHTDPNVNYNCQIRSKNDGIENGWSEFVEVPREDAGPPATLTQTITAPSQEVSAQTTMTVTVDVYCYGPASNEPYGFISANWIAQGFWTETLTYTYPTSQSIEEQQATPTRSDETQPAEQQESQSTDQQNQGVTSDSVQDTNSDDFQRGFFTNNPNSALSFLNNPFNITTIGFILSIVGILLQLRRGT